MQLKECFNCIKYTHINLARLTESFFHVEYLEFVFNTNALEIFCNTYKMFLFSKRNR